MKSLWLTISLLITLFAPPSFAKDVVGKSLLCSGKVTALDNWIGYVFGSEGNVEILIHRNWIDEKVDLENVYQRSHFDFYNFNKSQRIKYRTTDLKIYFIDNKITHRSIHIDRITLDKWNDATKNLVGKCIAPLDEEDFKKTMQQISQRHFDAYMKKVDERRELLSKRKI